MKKSELRQLIKEEIKKLNEAFKYTDDTAMIYVGDYPWYLKKILYNHIKFVNSESGLEHSGLGVAHIAQYRDEDFYKDVYDWLRGKITSKELNGRKYEDFYRIRIRG